MTHQSPNQIRITVDPTAVTSTASNMKNIPLYNREITIPTRHGAGNPSITFEASKLAHLTDGAVVASCEGTLVLATAVGELKTMSEFSESVDLRTEAREKSSARGYIPPGFLRTDMGSSEYEILLSRMIDRSIRPLFGNSAKSILTKNYQIQITSNLLSCDETYCTQALAINAVSASIHMSGVPWDGPIAAVKVGYVLNGDSANSGELICNPSREEMERSVMNLMYVGLKDGKCLMIETDAQQVDYDIYKQALYYASQQVVPIIDGIEALKAKFDQNKIDLSVGQTAPVNTGDGESAATTATTATATQEKPIEIITTQHGMISSMTDGMTKEETEEQFKNEILDIQNKIRNDPSVTDIINEFKLKFKDLYGDTRLGKHDRLPTMYRYRQDYFEKVKETLFGKKDETSTATASSTAAATLEDDIDKFESVSEAVAVTEACDDEEDTDNVSSALPSELEDIVSDEEVAASSGDSGKAPSMSLLGNIDSVIKSTLYDIESEVFRDLIIYDKIRCDGRDIEQIRDLTVMNDLLPAAHGSSLFQRGNTQVLVTATVGSPKLNKIRDMHTPGHPFKDCRLYFQYEMPRWSTNEIGHLGPNRRGTGHGALAKKALVNVLPTFEEFKPSIRIYSTVTASNGSSSMASVCGGSLALMDAGIPMRYGHVAGISIGLVSKPNLFDDNVQFQAACQQTGIVFLFLFLRILWSFGGYLFCFFFA